MSCLGTGGRNERKLREQPMVMRGIYMVLFMGSQIIFGGGCGVRFSSADHVHNRG